MGTNTANFKFRKPTVGADEDIWGDDYTGLPRDVKGENSPGLNGNWELLDQEFAENEALIAQLEADVGSLPTDLAALKIQVDGLYISATDDDPATTLGYGTWEAWGLGRALVGVGDNGEHDWLPDEERGSFEHQLTAGEIPAHGHVANLPDVQTTGAGGHSHTYTGYVTAGGPQISGGNQGSSGQNVSTNTQNAHTHTLDIPQFNTSSIGSDAPHVNEQPGTAVYIWKRLT